MTVTLFLSPWWIPALGSAAIWATAILWPISKPTGSMFDFGGTVDALIHAVLGVVATLVLWIAFLAIRLALA